MRTQVLSYGGGIQTIAMIVLALTGRIEMPDVLVMADTGREKESTFDYLSELVRPALQAVGKDVAVAPHTLATVDLYSGNGDLLIPVYTATGKLPTFCSTEWKERAIKRYLRAAGLNDVDCWIGYSADELDRADRKDDLQWYKRRYPLIEKGISRTDCKVIIEDYGWPLPYKSACWMCPNQDDDGWLETKNNYPADFQKAVELEKEIREFDDIWLHESRQLLDQVEFHPGNRRVRAGAYQCSFGCFI